MSNKDMSELSKPVAFIIGEESIDDFMRGYETFVVRGEDVGSTEDTMNLYSQEYVSALLAELEAKDKRIAELEAKLANCETQPVAWRHDDGPFAGMALTRSKSVADSWIANGWTVTPLFPAPPAPAAPESTASHGLHQEQPSP